MTTKRGDNKMSTITIIIIAVIVLTVYVGYIVLTEEVDE